MAQEIINVGTNPNDGTGDTLRGAFVKTDDNFTDLYTNKQNTLISGTNIKTVNSTSLLGSGNVSVQPTLVSGTNIKTINGNSILGSGDLIISGGVTGSGTTNYVSKFTAAGTIGDSIIFDNGTNVGIGNASPTSKLVIDYTTNGANGIVSRNLSTGSAAYGFIGVYTPTGGIDLRAHSAAHSSSPSTSMINSSSAMTNGLLILQAGANPIRFNIGGGEQMRISGAGNVGIGTSTPSAKLHVESSSDQILISGGTIQSVTSFAGGSMVSYDDSTSVWGLFSNVLTYNVTDEAFYLNSILVNDTSNSVNFGAKKLPNATSFTNSTYETLIGVYDQFTTDWETAIYAKRNIYCEDGGTTTILTIAQPNSSIDLVAKIGYGDRFFIAKISVIISWDASTYTYKITSTNTTSLDDADTVNINFNFELVNNEFFVKLQNDSGNDIYANINANIL